jgi:hypothetical protein
MKQKPALIKASCASRQKVAAAWGCVSFRRSAVVDV